MSSDGIFVIDEKFRPTSNRIPEDHHFKETFAHGSAYFSTESLAPVTRKYSQIGRAMSSTKETVLLLGAFVPPD